MTECRRLREAGDTGPACSCPPDACSLLEKEPWRKEAADSLRAIAYGCETMAEALEENEPITGIGAGMVLANHLPALPKHIRDVFMEYLSDEEAAGLRAELLYMEQREARRK